MLGGHFSFVAYLLYIISRFKKRRTACGGQFFFFHLHTHASYLATACYSAPTMTKTPSAYRVLDLPELLPLITYHLTPPDLSACTRVSHLWNDTFTPALWSTIDDRIYNWPRILKPECNNNKDSVSGAMDWTWDVFKKYVRFICHLSVSDWRVVDAAVGSRDRLLLKSLWVDMSQRYTGDGVAVKQGPIVFPETMPLKEREILNGMLQPDVEFKVNFNSDDWAVTCQVWLLILQIPPAALLGNLRLFALEARELDRVLSPVFLRKALAVHHRTLTTLQIGYGQLGLVECLEVLPNLQCLYTGYDPVGYRLLERSYSQLRILLIKTPLPGTTFHNLLKYLPGLDHLGVAHLWEIPDHDNYNGEDWKEGDDWTWKWRTEFKVSPLLDGVPSRLRGLHFFDECVHNRQEFMSEVAFDVLPSLAFLTELTIDATYPDLGPMLVKHCRLLQVFRNAEGCEAIYPDWNDETVDVNEMAMLLEGCSYLRVFDAAVHQIEADCLMDRPEWVCKDLEVFRCQMVGFNRQYDDVGSPNKEAVEVFESSGYKTLTRQQRLMVDPYLRCREQHHHAYDRLAGLKRLTTLDLGHEFLCPDICMRRHQHRILRDGTWGGRTYNKINGTIPETMELTLASGLDRLGALERLEVFGFNNVDHRIQEAELEWMAKSWPRLRVMCGLRDTNVIVRVDCEVTVELRERMQVLRPEVRHEEVKIESAHDGCLERLLPFGGK